MATSQDALTYALYMISHITSLITVLHDLQVDQDRQTEDAGLAAAAAAAMTGRTLAEADFTNAANAIGQILFAYNSGSPTQKSYLYKLL